MAFIEQLLYCALPIQDIQQRLEQLPNWTWSLGDSDFLGVHLVGRSQDGLRVDVIPRPQQSIYDLTIAYTNTEQTVLANEIVQMIITTLNTTPNTACVVPECLYAVCSLNELLHNTTATLALYTTESAAVQTMQRADRRFLVEIDTALAMAANVQFMLNEQHHWQCHGLTTDIVALQPWGRRQSTASANAELLAELKHEVSAEHLLAGQISHLEVVWQSSSSDDVLFQNRQTLQCYVVHLTWSGMPEQKHYPLTKRFSSLSDWFEQYIWPEQMDYYAIK